MANQADKHASTLIPVYISTHLNVEASCILWGRLVLELHLPPHIAQVWFQFWGQQKVALLASSQIIISVITPWRIHYLWSLVVEFFQLSLEVLDELFISFSHI